MTIFAPPAASFTSQDFRRALGMFATGVTVVTAQQANGALMGLTVSSFNSVSLTPPLVLWSLGLKSSRLQAFRDCSHYAINVLSNQQAEVAQQFASRQPDWAAIAHDFGPHGSPLLAGCLAHFECRNKSRYTEGDHDIFVGEVLHCAQHDHLHPLIYQAGQFHLNAI